MQDNQGAVTDERLPRIAFDYGDNWFDLGLPVRYMSIPRSSRYCQRDKERLIKVLNKEFPSDVEFMRTMTTHEGFRRWASQFLAW